MTAMIDLEPATRQMVTLLDNVTDDQLATPTPCEKYTLGDLIDHVSGLSQAFTAAAPKELGPQASQGPVPPPATRPGWATTNACAPTFSCNA
jgi:uncharacterized protein (TIGR03083 family)